LSDLDHAIAIAIKAHAGQVDKAGQPYILHLLRVMLKFESEDERIVAVMHDVVEDSEVTFYNLNKEGFSGKVVEAIECLTKRKNEDYESFIMRLSKNSIAKKIKIEDIRDNLDLNRLHKITEKDLQRIDKYHRALQLLTNK
jgi:(p)ppGpp synthase/HD superfamily hydrolase